MNDPISVRSSELVPLYRLLRERHDELAGGLRGLFDRIERRLFERLSIEEIEGLVDMDDAGVEELSKKL